jgi:hypothetical protein
MGLSGIVPAPSAFASTDAFLVGTWLRSVSAREDR